MANWNSALITWAKKCPVNASLVSLYIINLEDPSHFQQMDLFREAQPQPEHQQGMEEWWTDMLSWLIRHRDMVLRNLGTRLRKQTKDNETSGQIKVFWQDIEQKKIAKTLAAKDNLANLQVLTDIKTGALALKMSLQGVEALPPSRNLTSHANQTEVELGGQKAQATLLHTSGSANRDNQRRVVVSPGPRPSFSAVHTPPLGSGSSSPTLSPPPRPVFNSSDDEYEENEADGEEVFDRDNGDKDEVFGRPCGDMSWIKERPEFTFSLPLSKDWGPQITESYNKIKEKTSLGYEQVDEIALLSGVLHLNKAHVGFQANEITVITNDVLHRFYSNQQKEKDVERSIEAAALWGTWVQVCSYS
ncbi:hypothetical protein BCR41DRAFT_80152 [Lobosporangium transversale]|uniref:Uncharacterized protein n=1 Tax=Lobosporangium transversale TaxID=64571 RepID=A0A1Y2GM21_9FUNG|nr:hypothetical protein BCR41DRAFT_80152 [Lobosporangium transversale]ORZ14943.1 hypothetical protein BCR41DRAFT_80152 [Lobosporangium transversale]|eukprot:XP_021881075.1 hypothetical protein BCR41DRAFT_80152 [Lobosporangium transversale]